MSVTVNRALPAGRERRYRVLRVSPELLLHALVNPLEREGEIRYLTVEGLPEGTEIQAVHYSHERDSFEFRLWHQSFDVVPDGEFCPEIAPLFHQHIVPKPAEPRRGREFF